ncbi:lytic transglycosylase domain-containing protein [Streptomyces syringium]|uniref:lytic transglycosylase domain-containing protein n=1 Tax=Streptomyces syringium TaxID=76729 RepID=UPI0034398037
MATTGSRHPAFKRYIPATALAAYRNAERNRTAEQPNCHLSWELLAGIGMVESAHADGRGLRSDGSTERPVLGPPLTGGEFARIKDTDGGRWDGDKEYDRAVGPLQFLPSTWKSFAVDGNGDGRKDLNNIFDAAAAAGRYLCADGSDLRNPGHITKALLRYNYSKSYACLVLSWAQAYRSGSLPSPLSVTLDTPVVRHISDQRPIAVPHADKALLRKAPAGETPSEKPEPAQRTGQGAAVREDTHSSPRRDAQQRLTDQGRGEASEKSDSNTSAADIAQPSLFRPAEAPGPNTIPPAQLPDASQDSVPEPASEHDDLTHDSRDGTAEEVSHTRTVLEGTDDVTQRSGCAAAGAMGRASEAAIEQPGKEGVVEAMEQCTEQPAVETYGGETGRVGTSSRGGQ